MHGSLAVCACSQQGEVREGEHAKEWAPTLQGGGESKQNSTEGLTADLLSPCDPLPMV